MMPVFGPPPTPVVMGPAPPPAAHPPRNPIYNSVFGAFLSEQQKQAVSPLPSPNRMPFSNFTLGGPENSGTKAEVTGSEISKPVFAAPSATPTLWLQTDTDAGMPAGIDRTLPAVRMGTMNTSFPPVFTTQRPQTAGASGGGFLLGADSGPTPAKTGAGSPEADMNASIRMVSPKPSIFTSPPFLKGKPLMPQITQKHTGGDASSTSILGAIRPSVFSSKRNFSSMEVSGRSPTLKPVVAGTGSVFADVKRVRGETLECGKGVDAAWSAYGPQQSGGGTFSAAAVRSPAPTGTSVSLLNRSSQMQKQHGGGNTAKIMKVVRVFSSFMINVMNADEAQREVVEEFIEEAFFGTVESHDVDNFPAALRQLQSAWIALKGSQSQLKGERWVVLFALGSHLNVVTRTIQKEEEVNGNEEKEGTKVLGGAVRHDIWNVLSDSCTHANLLCEICLQLFSNQRDNHVPYCILPIVLRRARSVFELACNNGVSTVQSNMRSVLLKLHRYVRVAPPKRQLSTVVEKQRAVAFAALLSEMMLYGSAPPESSAFVEAFHQHCMDAVKIRCALYRHCADNLLQEPLTDSIIVQAMELLARAFVIVDDEAIENKRMLFVKLTACALALGRVPVADFQQAFVATGLEDLIVAVRSCNIRLFNVAMRNNSELYVRCGIHNVLQFVSKRISLLMVVKYYSTCFSDRIQVQDMIDYYQLPYNVSEGCNVWLLPLLVEKRINGVIESGVLILSNANPFDDYSKDAIRAFVE
ncbi:hypothetical protein, conserved [Trypanosoma brucei gambiense DAL972]|uniref:Uncharacterized protein n=1 Tax=Trypanosoma brucei gambiense (strain MHOM/CI/86/DAL972) TaxID=679716 RepID=D0A758_TRYB9|nr:hypothetical protein, conserved [Trypanosoma brucei gambiense DAL972]CBH17509.1 hypothetical protein, conserved [Trypanosoma brucei gambiense DAL972]|eukprot:XP_011779773.1 hypothetical protein, conserved [Trypanosoma brucei gambiense DAL972]